MRDGTKSPLKCWDRGCNERAFWAPGTAEQWIKEGKNAVTWARLSCHRFAANAVRLQLHALAGNPASIFRTLALLAEVKPRSCTTLRDRLIKIGAWIVCRARSITIQMAEIIVSRGLFQHILGPSLCYVRYQRSYAEDLCRCQFAWPPGGRRVPECRAIVRNPGCCCGCRARAGVVATFRPPGSLSSARNSLPPCSALAIVAAGRAGSASDMGNVGLHRENVG
jgi:hypothetical protein